MLAALLKAQIDLTFTMPHRIKSKGITVVSLFNGMNTGRQALENVGIKVNRYYSSEIKKFAIELTQFHFPDTIQLGDIKNWKDWDIDWKNVDLVLSGSPCKDLSIAGKRKGINGSNSGLFWHFIDILNHVKKVNSNVIFFQENVGSARKKDIGIMSRAMGLYPVRINSSLVVAQLRDRYYWTNSQTKNNGMYGDLVTNIPSPEKRNIMFKDILTNGFTDRKKCTALMEKQSTNAGYKEMNSLKAQKYLRSRDKMSMLPVVYSELSDLLYEDNSELKVKTNTKKGFETLTENDCLNLTYPTSKTRRGRVTKGKSPCLLQGNEPLYAIKGLQLRLLNKIELCRLQGFPDNYCDLVSRNQAASLLGDGWTLPIIEHFFQYLPFNKSIKELNK